MKLLAHILLLAAALLTCENRAVAASKPELKAYQEACLSFHNSNWERAERELGAFLQRFPNSEHRAEAALLQAQTRIKLKNFTGAIDLLNAGLGTAGSRSDEYLFRLGEAHFESGRIEAAADYFSSLPLKHPNSQRRWEAVVAEAAARAQLKQWARVLHLLQRPDGLFQTFARESPLHTVTVRGRLLLGEALLALGSYNESESAVTPLIEQKLVPLDAWQRDYLLARAQLAGGRPAQALETATNLTNTGTNQMTLMSEGWALLGRIHDALNQPEQALASWRQILIPGATSERQREALLRVSDLLIGQSRFDEGLQTLNTFLTTAGGSPAADMAWLTLGELRLKILASATDSSAETNLVQLAISAFDTLLKEFPGSSLAGRARLGRGWCLWIDNRIKESADAFAEAVTTLPPSYELAVARFKLADAFMALTNFNGALTNYQWVAANSDGIPGLGTNLVERALCHVVRSAAEVGDAASANAAMTRLLEEFPEGSMVENALQFVGNQPSPSANPKARRAVLEGFLTKSPGSSLASGVRIAIARTYEQEHNWEKAEEEYAAWLAAFPDDPVRPRAEYSRALAAARSGNETNALALFTNFVAHFPTNELTLPAQWWVADHYWRAEDYVSAERHYQMLNDSKSRLHFEARMMAGRAAIARQSPEEAVSYFTNLANDVDCPKDILAQALFAYGDCLMTIAVSETNQSLGNFTKAIKVFSKLTQLNPDTKIALLAQGKMGDCYLQLGSSDPGQYRYASNAYQQIIESMADPAVRALAEIGLGNVMEREAHLAGGTNATILTQEALDHYLNVVYGSDEPRDLTLVRRAGLDALRLMELLQAWEQMVKLCETLSAQLPPLQPMIEKKKARAQDFLSKNVD